MSVHVQAAEGSSPDVVFSITGSFDPFAASRFRARIADLAPDVPVVLDFSHATEVSDLALAVLASSFEPSARPRVVLRGLTHHQERMLRYLGIASVVLDERGPDERLA